MRKFLLPLLLAVFALSASAQDVPLAFSFEAATDGTTERTLSFGSATGGVKYYVDFGDGNLVETEEIDQTTSISTVAHAKGIPSGTVKVYADAADITSFTTSATAEFDANRLKSIDLSKLVNLNQLTLNYTDMETIDLTPLQSLTVLSLMQNKFKSMDLTVCPKLTSANLSNGTLESVKVAGMAEVSYFNVNDNPAIKTLDLSNMPLLANLYAQQTAADVKGELTEIDMTGNVTKLAFLYLNNNKLQKLNIPVEVATFEAMNNEISEFSVVDATKTCKLSGNKLTIATLPTKPAGLNSATKIKNFTYAPQADLEVKDFITEAVLDLSAQLTAVGEGTEAQTTVYTFKAGETALAEGTDYTVVEPGKFQFAGAYSDVVCEMVNEAFPKFQTVADATFKTTAFNVKEKVLAFSFEAATDGTTERTLSFGSATGGVKYYVDFGDGNLVETEEIAQTQSISTTVHAKGIPSGTVKVYADAADITSFTTSATAEFDANRLKSIDLSQLVNLNQLTLNYTDMETLDLSSLQSLTVLNLMQNKFKSMDLTVCPKLSNANLSNGTLESVKVAGMAEVNYLNVNDNPAIKSLDLSNMPLLANLYAQQMVAGVKGELTEIDMTGNTTKLASVYLNNNKIQKLIVPVEVGTFEAKNNEISEFSVVDATKTCNIEGNKLTIATLPAKPAGLNTASKIKKFTYAPQADLEVETLLSGNVLDLSAQLTAIGEGTEPQTTVYTFKAGETALVEGTDYTVVEPGKFQFTKANADIVCCMVNEAFPKFQTVADATFKTVPFSISDEAVGISTVAGSASIQNGKYLQNGTIVIIKNGSKYNVAGQIVK